MNLTDVPCRAGETVSRVVSHDTFIIDVQRSQLHDLNTVGGRIWELTDGNRSVADIVAVMCDEYEVDMLRAESDVLAFLDALQSRGLIDVGKQGEVP